jgi:hypothetical protein
MTSVGVGPMRAMAMQPSPSPADRRQGMEDYRPSPPVVFAPSPKLYYTALLSGILGGIQGAAG